MPRFFTSARRRADQPVGVACGPGSASWSITVPSKAVGHQGGRYLWQLAGAEEFLVAWKAVANPTAEENRILSEFFQHFGAYPFANIAGPRA